MLWSKHGIYTALEKQQGNSLAKWLNVSLMVLIMLNVLVVILESEPGIHAQYRPLFERFEIFSIVVFSAEYLLRVWAATESDKPRFQPALRGRLRYMLTPMSIIDLLSILPFYLGVFFGVNDLRILRSLRLLRILKLTRYSASLELLIQVTKQEAENLISALLVLGVLIVLSATGMYLVEGDLQPQQFGSIPRALWWALVTLSTIGYGDAIPITIAGKLFAGLIIMTGVAVAALPAAILSSGLINELNRRRETFRAEVVQALADRTIDFAELRHLEALRLQIGVSHTDARLIYKEVKHANRLRTHLNCPHCNEPLVIAHPVGQVQVDKPAHPRPQVAA